MNACGLRFKRTLEEGVQLAGERLRQYRAKFHVDSFFAETVQDHDTAGDIAAKALCDLCLTNGSFNRCSIAVKAVMVFLHAEASESPVGLQDCESCLIELNRILTGTNCTVERIAEWVGRWFKF
jgi:hypothetical protein